MVEVSNVSKKNKSNYKVFWLFFLPPGFWLIVLFLVPLVVLWLYSFGTTDEFYKVHIDWNVDNYIGAVNPDYLYVLFKSVLLSAITTVICIVLGFFIALFIAFSKPKIKALCLLLIILPFWTNLLIRIFGLVSILSDSGVVNSIMELIYNQIKSIQGSLGITIISSEFFTPIGLLYNYYAVIAGMVYVSLPFAVLPIYGALDKLDVSYLEASLDLGASHYQTIKKVMIPMIMPGIMTAVFLTFIPSLSTFLIPDMLGGPNAEMIANVIQRQFGSASNWPLGSALTFILMYITFFIMVLKSLYKPRSERISEIAS